MIALLLLLAHPAAAQGTSPATPPATLPAMMEIAKDSATPLLGRAILDREGQTAGRIVDVLVDGAGQVHAVVVDFGGFLGVGQRRIAVAWSALRFDATTQAAAASITIVLSAADIASAPEFKPDTPANMAVAPHP